MYDSGITAQALIEEVQKDIDVAPDIELKVYLDIINSLQRLLYSEIIRGKVRTVITPSVIPGEYPEDICIPLKEQGFRYEDIFTVYAVTGDGELDRVQLIDSTAIDGAVFPYTYYKLGEYLALNIPSEGDDYPDGERLAVPGVKKVIVIHLELPELLTEDNYGTSHIAVPVEFIDLVKAKVRGDVYRLANEGNAASDWLTYYNVLLEDFRGWVEQRRATLGV